MALYAGASALCCAQHKSAVQSAQVAARMLRGERRDIYVIIDYARCYIAVTACRYEQRCYDARRERYHMTFVEVLIRCCARAMRRDV